MMVANPFIAQETKKLKVEDGELIREYSVLKSDKTIKHGPFTQYYRSKRINISGYFKDNLKDSTWTVYHLRSTVIKERGHYSKDIKIGEWSYYDRDGQEIQVYDHTRGEIVRFKPDDPIKKYVIITDAGTDSVLLERPPMYVGGKIASDETFRKAKFRYPPEAMDAGIQGTVVISFFIDREGKASGHMVHTGLSKHCDEEALRVVKAIPDNWIPALYNGEAVASEYLYPVEFVLRTLDRYEAEELLKQQLSR